MKTIDVYLELGKKRTFAGAIDWPGWCRAGRDEASALQALLDAAPRYVRAIAGTSLGFEAPLDMSALAVVERLAGSATTDFGAPDAAPPSDSQPIGDDDLRRFEALLGACWAALEAAARAAEGVELRKGPRGGGRDLDKIVRHVLDAEQSYVGRIGAKPEKGEVKGLREEIGRARDTALRALAASAHGEMPERGLRGGAYWPARYYVRRSAWHVLDHAWEIEDRAT